MAWTNVHVKSFWNLNENTNIFFQEKEIENDICTKFIILFRTMSFKKNGGLSEKEWSEIHVAIILWNPNENTNIFIQESAIENDIYTRLIILLNTMSSKRNWGLSEKEWSEMQVAILLLCTHLLQHEDGVDTRPKIWRKIALELISQPVYELII